MKISRIIFLVAIVATIVLVGKATVAQAGPAPTGILAQEKPAVDLKPSTGVAPGQSGINNISASTVNSITPFLIPPGAAGDVCFNVTISSPDAEYLDRFDVDLPDGWTVNYLVDVPGTGCGYGHNMGTEAGNVIYWQTNGYPPQTGCGDWSNGTYNFCANVTPTCTGSPWSLPWNIIGDSYGSPPHSVAGTIDAICMEPGVYILPDTLEVSGCNGVDQVHTLTLYNNTGSAGTFNMTYAVPSGNGTLTGPATVVSTANGQAVPFDVTLTPDLCVPNGGEINATVDASGNGYSDQSVINKTVATEPSWETVPASAPTWPGYGYPRDGCTALNAAGQSVTYIFGDTTSIFGFWGYNHATNTWFQPGAANTPADRWAPDWAYDPDTNRCYVTGGASIPGGGDYNTAYVYNPVSNAFTALGSFTSMRDFHNSWVGTIDGDKYLCIGGGVNSSSVMVQSTQCYDLAQAAPGAWNAENAQMAAFPNDPFGAADGLLHAASGDQFWYTGGAVNAGASISEIAYFWDDADNAWHSAGNTGMPRYRVEGDFFNGAFYQLGGSSGGFAPTADVVRGTFDGVGWTWTVLSPMNNARMDNVVGLAGATLWSVDGYGASSSNYVEFMAFCPECDLQGWLEGTVLDGETGEPPCTNATVTINPGDIHVGVDPATGNYGPVELLQGTYDVEASALGFTTETAQVVIIDELTTVQDFALYRPVIDVDPDSLAVQAGPNIEVTVPLTITNEGSVPLSWKIVEIPDTAAAAASVAGTYQQTPAAVGVDPFITEQIVSSTDGKVDFFIAFKDTADLSGAYALKAKTDKVAFVRQALRQAADKAQANVRAWLDGQGITYKVFTIDNTLLVHAGQSVIDALAAFPEVSGFHGNHTYTILPVKAQSGFGLIKYTVETSAPDAIIPWDLNIMNVPQVWDELGVTGQGVIVANVDTGVDYTHEALYPNYLCDGGPHTDCWYDPDYGSTTPNDTNGHGTGTMSQMAADNNAAFQYAVGGAPDAGWIACLGCPGGSCPDTALNGCADWLVNTTPNTPDLVNNSWGTWSALCDPWYDGKLAAYRAAGILPVFAAGNIGNACNTSTPPANSIDAFAVGATTSSDVQASFSSTGPGLCTGRTQFPDVTAPGDATCGAVVGGGYSCGFGGTSFAAPRAAGCAALVKSAAPWLTIDEIQATLMATADNKPNSDCGTPQDDPNYRYGDGRVNCFEAVSVVFNADIPWVTEVPTSGILLPGDQVVDVTFECTPDQVGETLYGTLRIKHNDPCEDPIDVPVQLTCRIESPLISWDKTIDGIPWQPGFEITVQTSDTIVVEETLHLMPVAFANSMPFVPVKVSGGNSTASLTASSPERPLGTPQEPANPEDILWDQPLSSVSQAAYVNQDFPDYPAYSSFLADDFVNETQWTVDTIFVPGDGWNGFSTLFDATALTWQIYADNAGVPAGDPSGSGSAPVWTLTLAPTDAQVVISTGTPGGYPSNATLNLSAPVIVPPGHWWLVFYPTMSFDLYGQYGRQPADTTNGYVGQFINPGGGFGYGTAWQPWTVLGGTLPDIAFRLEGIAAPPTFHQVEFWDPSELALLDWAATGGEVIVDPSGFLEWKDDITEPADIMLTKWFHVEPCTWTETTLREELWLNTTMLDARPVTVNKLPPVLDIGSLTPDIDVLAGVQATFVLTYSNTGGYENDVVITNTFPAEALFVSSVPPPTAQDPSGTWARWELGDLPTGAKGNIAVTVQIGMDVPNEITVAVWDGIFNHIGELKDEVNTFFTIKPISWDKTIDGLPWEPGFEVTKETSDTIVIQEVLSLLPETKTMLFVPVKVEGKGVNASLTTSSPDRPLGTPQAPANPEDILWDQPLSAVSQAAYVDQEFPDAAAYSSFLADDFVNTENWYIDTIFVPGDGWNGFSSLANADSLTWQIYADNAGIPAGDPAGGGNPPFWTLTLSPSDAQVVLSTGTPGGYVSNATLALTAPVTVPPGHWWLVFYPTMSFGSYGQYGRQPADTVNGYTGQFINPGGGFGYGTAWQAWTVLGGTLPDIAFRLEGSSVPPSYVQTEDWDPAKLALLDWAATGGEVTIDATGFMTWTGEVAESTTITLTKWFLVEPCTWTLTTVDEVLWLNDEEIANRPVIVNKLPPDLSIDSLYDPAVLAGQQATFVLQYGNAGGFENDVWVRNNFSVNAPFVSSVPPPTDVDPAGLWAEWAVGNLAMDAEGTISVTVQIAAGLPAATEIDIWDGIYNHVGVALDEVTTTFVVEELPVVTADLEVVKVAPEEVIAGFEFTYVITVTNNGPADATGVEVVDTLPAGVTFVSASTGCVNATGVVTCDVGDLAVGDSVTITIVVVPPAVASLVNTVAVTGDQEDPDETNNEATATSMVKIQVLLPLVWKAP